LALVSNESCNYIAVFTGGGLAILLDVEFTLFANGAGIPFAANKCMHTYMSNNATTEETFFILPFLLEL
jgi:hypothetical protein